MCHPEQREGSRRFAAGFFVPAKRVTQNDIIIWALDTPNQSIIFWSAFGDLVIPPDMLDNREYIGMTWH
jgi:hypothetical protein